MSAAWFVLLAVAPLPAAIIHGVVLEHATQRPLARSQVRLHAATGAALRTVAEARTDRAGNFWFPSLPDGAYLLSASRAGFLEGRYGQTRPTGPGALLNVKGDGATFAEIRLHRLGGVTGRVFDENYVGLPDIPVIAYPARLPLRIENSAKTDDRGVYRIGRLPPGRYWIRTGSAELEDRSGLLPTFFPYGMATADARLLTVTVDRDEPETDLQPSPGKLFAIGGTVRQCPPRETNVRVTLSSDTGSRETTAPCDGPFLFEGLSPNRYELYAEPVNVRQPVAAYEENYFDQYRLTELTMTRFPTLRTEIIGPKETAISVRRKNLSGSAPARKLDTDLGPGYWEIFADPPPGHYFAGLTASNPYRRRTRQSPADIAPEFYLDPNDYVNLRIQIAAGAAQVEGIVRREGDPVAATPVYLYPIDPDVRRRMHGLQTAFSGAKGEYRFENLAPGSYYLLATWDLDEIDETTLKDARAQTVILTASEKKTLLLDVHGHVPLR